MDWVIFVRKFSETVAISRVHLEMVLTLKGCIWGLQDESKAVLMFKILSPLFSTIFFFFPFGLYLEEMGYFLWLKDRNLRPS